MVHRVNNDYNQINHAARNAMRIVRFIDAEGVVRLGAEQGNGTAMILGGDLMKGVGGMGETGESAVITRRLAPIMPCNIYCIGRNYAEHAKEGGAEIPETPVIFMKPTTAVTNPESPVVIPACSSEKGEVDFEAELAVVIGKLGRNISEADAMDYVLGYTIGNDISARKFQKQGGGGQWIRGKSFDTFCPLGPAIVTKDEIVDPQELGIKLTLNGEVMQEDVTGNMIFPVAELIAYISRDTTLLPGTVIMTGTPSGVGFARKPAVWLKSGDEMVVEIEGIGELRNTVESA
ncbi:Ureidoglycolate lyase [Poriferisphaera corsica]|uniref:Ureidoglycolate lyase n=1 Tax=Poriferisphaera corsica TaxID=2528020 RepID=A0A517YRZ2_9BACT|nr:fumarylacetoacetate hydrolase family protein [Poriferisphaera corsica]QDU32989.1 Ureidoglycolate lyase [Poriferisphaera corsica]